jgi:hypothetical protein
MSSGRSQDAERLIGEAHRGTAGTIWRAAFLHAAARREGDHQSMDGGCAAAPLASAGKAVTASTARRPGIPWLPMLRYGVTQS